MQGSGVRGPVMGSPGAEARDSVTRGPPSGAENPDRRPLNAVMKTATTASQLAHHAGRPRKPDG